MKKLDLSSARMKSGKQEVNILLMKFLKIRALSRI